MRRRYVTDLILGREHLAEQENDDVYFLDREGLSNLEDPAEKRKIFLRPRGLVTIPPTKGRETFTDTEFSRFFPEVDRDFVNWGLDRVWPQPAPELVVPILNVVEDGKFEDIFGGKNAEDLETLRFRQSVGVSMFVANPQEEETFILITKMDRPVEENLNNLFVVSVWGGRVNLFGFNSPPITWVATDYDFQVVLPQ